MASMMLFKTEAAEMALKRFMYEHPEYKNQTDAINAIIETLYEED